MALLWIDGFEQYANQADITDAYDSLSALAISILTGRNTGAGNNKCVQIDFGNITLIRRLGLESTPTVVVGFAWQKAVNLATNDIFRLYNGGTEMIVLKQVSGGELGVDRGATNLFNTSGLGLVAGTWFYVELKIFIHDSAGTVELWIDGVKEIDETSVDTKNGTPNTIDSIWMVGDNGNALFDDLYFLDDSGSDNTDRLGDSRVETVFPDADGNTNDFTRVGGGSNNFEAVDDGSTPDDDSTYNHSSTAADKELYGFEALQGQVDTVFAVQATMYARKQETGERVVRVVARSNVTEVDSGDLTLGAQYRYLSNMYENDPDGGGNWDEAAVNAAQFGFKLQT